MTHKIISKVISSLKPIILRKNYNILTYPYNIIIIYGKKITLLFNILYRYLCISEIECVCLLIFIIIQRLVTRRVNVVEKSKRQKTLSVQRDAADMTVPNSQDSREI